MANIPNSYVAVFFLYLKRERKNMCIAFMSSKRLSPAIDVQNAEEF